ncbi:LpxD N-terminal domain-containing protein [Halegenticoccus tardaugens]|uniref:LpxD N-terminal domain-containing protein n=1 Tax=Halegenticoccus tardaugens TaxID=2071624 RepID=UPI0013E934FC|nr:LpxD N-terminal domain-containing protein [Halegenticoccus tardaugens]
MPELRAAHVAWFLGRTLAGRSGSDVWLTGVDALDEATRTDLAFSVSDDPARIEASDAGLVICPETTPTISDRPLVRTADPKLAFVKVAREFFVEPVEETSIHPTAVVEEGAAIGNRCVIGAHVFVGDAVRIGDDCRIHAGTVLGEAGFGFARDERDRPLRQIHDGAVVIEDGVEIGANCAVDRAVFGETVVGAGSVLSGGVHVAHQVKIGRNVSMAYGAGVSGSTMIGDGVIVHPHVSVAGHLSVGDGAELGIGSTVLDNVPPETTVVGTPARPITELR